MSLINQTGIFTIYDRFSNLFPLNCKVKKNYQEGSLGVQPTIQMIKRIVTQQFISKLKIVGYTLSKKYIAYSEQNKIDLPHEDVFSIYDGFEFRVIILNNNLMMCINPHLVIRTNCSIEYLVKSGVVLEKLKDFSVRYRGLEGRLDGYLIETIVDRGCYICRVKNYREFKEETLPAGKVFPEPKPELIQHFLSLLNRNFDLISKLRELSFLNSKTASKDRFYKTLEIVNMLKRNVFPINFIDWEVDLETTPTFIKL